MTFRHWAAALVAIVSLSACATPAAATPLMPHVVGLRLDVALSDIRRAGYTPEVEVLGGGGFGIMDTSNCLVCSQDPVTGVGITSQPRVIIERTCDRANAASWKGGSASLQVVTVHNTKQFAGLRTATDACSADIMNFAARFDDRLIQFDGSIRTTHLDDFLKSYDIVIGFGDAGKATTGPTFTFRGVSYNDLNVKGQAPESVGVGDNLRVTARIDTFDTRTCEVVLRPEITKYR